MAFEFNNPIISKMRKGDSSDPFIPYSILLQIVNGKVVLPEKPNQFERVRVTSPNGAEILYENISGTPKANEFYVDYTNSVVYFDSSRNNTQMVFTFKGEGLQYIPSSIVYTSNDGTQVTQTLDEYVEDSKSQIDQKVASVDADVQRMLSDGNTKIDEMDAKISEANTAISGATTATQNANASSASATNAASAANSAATTTQIIWKSPVTNYADIATTYPSPSVGWSVQVTSTNDRYRYDGSAWVKIANYSTTGLETTSNVQIVDSAKASIIRDSIHSGFTQLSSITNYPTTANKFKLSQDSVAYINGYKVTIPANTDVTTPAAPTFGTQTDVFWLESYLDSTGYQMISSIQSKSNITDLSGAGFTKDTVDVGLWKKVDGTKKDGYVYAIEMFSIRRRNSGGYRKDNLNGSRTYTSTTLSTVASTSSSDVTVVSATGLSVGDSVKIGSTSVYKINAINGTTITLGRNADSAHASGSSVVLQSDRPDGNYADIITSDDIIDLRHKVSLTGVNSNQLVDENFDKLIRGDLQTVAKPTLTKDVYGLKRITVPQSIDQSITPSPDTGIVGLEWDRVADTYVRLDGAVGRSPSDFDNFYPWAGMRRCILSDYGTIVAYYGESGYIEDGSVGQVMVEIPCFYYKSELVGDKYRWRISPVPKDGYKLHPAFVRNGRNISKIYFSAYEGSLYDVSAKSYILNDAQIADFTMWSGDKLSSIINAKPISGYTQNLTIGNARILARNRGIGWEQQDFLTSSAIQLLILIEYATFDSQSAIGNGVTSITDDGVTNNAINTGYTSSLGNRSGQSPSISHYRTGQTTKSISYRGIENFWGNIWKWVDGLNIKADNNPYVADFNFKSDIYANEYKNLGLLLANTNGYVSDITFNSSVDYGFLPTVVSGSSTTKLTDYYYQTTGNRVALLGGDWSGGSGAGAFYWHLGNSSGIRYRGVGARLLYIG